MDFLSGLKKRCLELVVKSAIGRFFKDINQSNIEEPKLSAQGTFGLSFRLANLELNDVLFNTELLVGTPLRLVRGTVNEISGELSIGSKDARSLEVEGVDLTFDLVTPVQQHDNEADHNRRHNGSNPHPMHGNNNMEQSDIGSSLLGKNFKDIVEKEVLPYGRNNNNNNNAASSAEALRTGHRAAIDEGVEALASTIKGLVHSLRGTVKHITVRLRFPPPGDQIPAGATVLPDGCVELMLHLKGSVQLLDETDVTAFGNSFKKRILFSGIRCAIYDPKEGHREVEQDGVMVQLVDRANTFLSGDMESVENLFQIEYTDVDQSSRSREKPHWSIKLVVNQVHMVMSPKQLAQLSIIGAFIMSNAPDEEGQNASMSASRSPTSTSNPQVSVTPSKFNVRFSHVSCFVLTQENRETVRHAWEQFPRTRLVRSLTVPHYSVQTTDFMLLFCNAMTLSRQEDDASYALFKQFGGRYLSLGLASIDVMERRPGVDPTPLLRHTPFVGNERYQVVCAIRTSCPIPPLAAEAHGVVVPDNPHKRPIVRQDIRIATQSSFVLSIDVETLDRLLNFYSIVDAHLFTAINKVQQKRNSVQERGARPPNNESDDALFDELHDMHRITDEELSIAAATQEGATVQDTPPAAPIPPPARDDDGGRTTMASEEELFVIARTLFVDVAQVKVDIGFPVRSDPNMNVYGPLTRRLFDELSRLALVHHAEKQAAINIADTPPNTNRSSSAAEATTSSSAHDSEEEPVFLTKRLAFVAEDCQAELPHGDASYIVGNIGSLSVAFVDDETTTVLGKITFHRQLTAEERMEIGGAANGLMAEKPSFVLWMKKPTSTGGVNTNPNNRDSPDEQRQPSAQAVPRSAPEIRSSAWSAMRGYSAESRLSDVVQQEENAIAGVDNDIEINIRHADASFHQDEFLLLQFLLDELVECVDTALLVHQELLQQVAEANTKLLNETSRSTSSFHTCDSGDRSSRDDKESLWVEPRAAALRDAIRQSSLRLSTKSKKGKLSRSTATDNNAAMISRVYHSARSQDSSIFHDSNDGRHSMARTTFGLRLHADGGSIVLSTPRLNPSGQPVGEPCSMLLPPEVRFAATSPNDSTNDPESSSRPRFEELYHTYVIDAANANIVVLTTSVSDYSENQLQLFVRLESVDLHESLPQPPAAFVTPATFGAVPDWGSLVSLVRSYSHLYNRSHNVHAPATRQAVIVWLDARKEMAKMTKHTEVSLRLDRCCLHHQTAHDGDHWVLALMNFLSDTPPPLTTTDDVAVSQEGTPLGAEGHEYSRDDPRSVSDEEPRPAPINYTSHVVLIVADVMAQYQPFGRKCKAVLLCPQAQVDTGLITSADKRSVISLSLSKLQLFLHNDFQDELLRYDDTAAHMSAFGQTKCGVASDLISLGFVSALMVETTAAASPNVTIRLHDVPNKPVLVEVTHLKGDVTVAYDTFYFLQLIQSHWATGADLDFLPSPYSYCEDIMGPNHVVNATSEGQEEGKSAQQRGAGPVSQVFVEELPLAIQSLLGQSVLQALAPVPQHVDPVPAPIPTGPRRLLDDVRDDVDDDGFVDVASELPHLDIAHPQWEFHNPSSATDVSQLFQSKQKHFSVHGGPQRYRTALCAPVKLVGLPPVAVEIIIAGVHVDVKLYGGSDFSLGVPAPPDRFFMSSHAFQPRQRMRAETEAEYWDETTSSDPPGRRTDECIRIHAHHLFVQVDLFEPNFDVAMQLIVRVYDAEVEDGIELSPVQTLLMCSVPREFRDNEGNVFEMKWVSRTPSGRRATGVTAEEDISIRLQPLSVTLHRRVIDLLTQFFSEVPDVEATPSTMYFRRILIHPLTLNLNVHFEVQNYHSAIVQGEVRELYNLLPSVEGSRVQLPLLVLDSFPVQDFALQLVDVLTRQVNAFDAVLMLLCGIQPLRSGSEALGAAAELVVVPLDHYRRNRGLFSGIQRGLLNFTTRLSAEALNISSGATRMAHETLHTAAGLVVQREPLSRGSQAANATEGFVRAASELQRGFSDAAQTIRISTSADGSLAYLPVAALVPVNGVFRALTEAFVGVRNSIRPESRALETKIYKE